MKPHRRSGDSGSNLVMSRDGRSRAKRGLPVQRVARTKAWPGSVNAEMVCWITSPHRLAVRARSDAQRQRCPGYQTRPWQWGQTGSMFVQTEVAGHGKQILSRYCPHRCSPLPDQGQPSTDYQRLYRDRRRLPLFRVEVWLPCRMSSLDAVAHQGWDPGSLLTVWSPDPGL